MLAIARKNGAAPYFVSLCCRGAMPGAFCFIHKPRLVRDHSTMACSVSEMANTVRKSRAISLSFVQQR